MNELKFAVRRLLKQSGFTATALLTLALCLGANMTIFAVVDTVLLRPLPFPASDRLVTVYNSYPRAGLDRSGASIRNYFTRRNRIPAFASVSSLRYGSEIVGAMGGNERRDVIYITPEFFTTLGVSLAMGRSFAETEMTPHADNAVVIADDYWRQRYNADPQVLGRSLFVGGVSKTVVGVLPPGFRYLSSAAQIYLPLVSSEEQRSLNALHAEQAQMIARLKTGASVAQAQSQIEADDKIQSRGYPWAEGVAAAGYFVTVAGLHEDHVAAIRPTLLLLQSGVLCLLLIGSVNLINLLLVRANAHRKEMGVRQALGAGNRHVIRQVLSEALVLSVVGSALGLMVGVCGMRLLGWFGASQMPLAGDIALNLRLIGFALASALVLGPLIAAPIAWLTLRRPLAGVLQAQTRGGTGDRATQRLRHAFIVAQIALALVLLSGAGLLAVSLQQAMTVAPGFRADHLLTAQLGLPGLGYPDASARTGFAERALAQLERQPGVVAAGLSTNLPVQGRNSFNDNNAMTVPGYVPQPGVSPLLHYRYGVSGDYFAALAIPLRAGRFLGSEDSRSAQRVCVVDEDFAGFYWPQGKALGQRVFEGPDARDDDQSFTVVGIVGAVKQTELTEARGNGAIYFPYRHLANASVYLVARSEQKPEALATTLRAVVRNVDPQLALDQVKAMDTRIADTLVARRSPALLAGFFSATALLLAGLGTFGVLSYAVAQRRREVAMRMALGARPRQIGGQFLRLGLRLLAAGSALGLLGAWATGTAMQSVLYQVPSLHLASLLASIAMLATMTLAACLLPSLRASRISPMAVLGDE